MSFDFSKLETKPEPAKVQEQYTQEESPIEDYYFELAEVQTIHGIYLLSNCALDFSPYFIAGLNELGFQVLIPKKDIIDIIERPRNYKTKYSLFGGLLGWIAKVFF